MRNGEGDDYLFPTVYGEILSRTSLQKGIVKYCHERGIQKSGIHIYRHTFITRSVEKNVSSLILKNITGHSSFKQIYKSQEDERKDKNKENKGTEKKQWYGKKEKTGGFNDYPQRDYDFDELEKKLLGWE